MRRERRRGTSRMGLNTVTGTLSDSSASTASRRCQTRGAPFYPLPRLSFRHGQDLAPSLSNRINTKPSWYGCGEFGMSQSPNRARAQPVPPPRVLAGSGWLPITPWFLVVQGPPTPASRQVPGARRSCHAASSHEPHEPLAGILPRLLPAPISAGAHVRWYPPRGCHDECFPGQTRQVRIRDFFLSIAAKAIHVGEKGHTQAHMSMHFAAVTDAMGG